MSITAWAYGERGDLRVGHAALGVLASARKKIVGRGEHGRQQQIEVGEQRGPLVDESE
jgi:hypothetical protein